MIGVEVKGMYDSSQRRMIQGRDEGYVLLVADVKCMCDLW